MKIVISDHQDIWKEQFAAERGNIYSLIGFLNPVIEHIGSTSVPGLCAKPTIDIQVGVLTSKDLDKTILPMQEQYTYVQKFEPDWPSRRYYCKYKSDPNKPIPRLIGVDEPEPVKQGFTSLVNIHIFVKDTYDWVRHIALREYLVNNSEVCDEYGRLKKQLSKQEFENIIAYNNAKNDFIKRIQKEAIEHYGHSYY